MSINSTGDRMTDKTRRSVPANGAEIIRFRKEKGMGQENFSRKLGFSKRTLQRAEQGKYVSPEALNDIAISLKVPVTHITASESHSSPETEDDDWQPSIRFVKIATASVFIEAKWYQKFSYEFRIDPDEDTANKIADVIDLLGEIDQFFGSYSNKIRLIGRTNSLLKVLEDIGVYFHIGTYNDYHIIEDEKTDPYDDGPPSFTATTYYKGEIIISEESKEHITDVVYRSMSKVWVREKLKEKEEQGYSTTNDIDFPDIPF